MILFSSLRCSLEAAIKILGSNCNKYFVVLLGINRSPAATHTKDFLLDVVSGAATKLVVTECPSLHRKWINLSLCLSVRPPLSLSVSLFVSVSVYLSLTLCAWSCRYYNIYQSAMHIEKKEDFFIFYFLFDCDAVSQTKQADCSLLSVIHKRMPI